MNYKDCICPLIASGDDKSGCPIHGTRMTQEQIKELFIVNGITDSQDRAVFGFLMMAIINYQMQYGVEDIKIRRFLTMITDFMELELDKRK